MVLLKSGFIPIAFNKLNIENLFSSDGVKPYTNGKIDIETLFKTEEQQQNDFDPKMLTKELAYSRKQKNYYQYKTEH